ncbi:MAG: hypothetical protein KJ949_01660 [Nanoarchaeota archaeon]|nr:hypothetical protein [Nanoarchaeota archaeon]MBU4308206.1 hypothetical protein [Nanoarchaeota archaeon]
MTEHYTEEQFIKYRLEFPEVIQDVVGSVLKYASIVVGVYSICKDEKDLTIATFAGAIYVVGSLLKGNSDQVTQVKQFSKLEEALKNKS